MMPLVRVVDYNVGLRPVACIQALDEEVRQEMARRGLRYGSW
jgi:hypothetical protein